MTKQWDKRNRTPISKKIIKPKYGDFLVRYNTLTRELPIVEIFKELNQEYGAVEVLLYWNFTKGWGKIPHNINDIEDNIFMGGGKDTYFATNDEKKLLMDKLNNEGLTWDFKHRKLINL